MNRKEFGDLVAALRQDLAWTQSQLAESSELDAAVISQIERGVKKTLDAVLCAKLAQALRLTASEQKEFLLAASGLEVSRLLRPPGVGFEANSGRSIFILEEMIDLVKNLMVPAFLVDSYSDVLAANLIAAAFFQLPPEMMENAGTVPGGYNIIRMVFGRDGMMKGHFGRSWNACARSTMLAFRLRSLSCRAQPYFQTLIKTFRDPHQYPRFNRYWKRTPTGSEAAASVHVFRYRHEIFGKLEYMVSPIQTMTRHGDLFVNQLLPMNENTGELFSRFLNEYGQHTVRLGAWPEKNIPRAAQVGCAGGIAVRISKGARDSS